MHTITQGLGGGGGGDFLYKHTQTVIEISNREIGNQ